jgi:hypothetical protein
MLIHSRNAIAPRRPHAFLWASVSLQAELIYQKSESWSNSEKRGPLNWKRVLPDGEPLLH